MSKKLLIVIGVLIVAVLAYLGYRYYVNSTRTGEFTITGTPVEFLKARNAYITSVIAGSEGDQVIITALQGTNLVTPPSPGAPLVLTDATIHDELYFVYYTKGTRDALYERGCFYSAPQGGGSLVGSVGGAYLDSLFPSVAGHTSLASGPISGALQSHDPNIKISDGKLEITAELSCGEGANKVTLITGKAIVELQK